MEQYLRFECTVQGISKKLSYDKAMGLGFWAMLNAPINSSMHEVWRGHDLEEPR